MATDALTLVFDQYFPLIREKCARMLRDRVEAEDVAQETFIRLWQSELHAADPRQVTAWIYRTSTRLAIDRLRSRNLRDSFSASLPSPPTPWADDAGAMRRELEQLARRLPPRELEVALLHRLDGLSQPQVAEVTGLSERTIRRMLQKFDERLERYRAEALS